MCVVMMFFVKAEAADCKIQEKNHIMGPKMIRSI